jgi:hypothetical protein
MRNESRFQRFDLRWIALPALPQARNPPAPSTLKYAQARQPVANAFGVASHLKLGPRPRCVRVTETAAALPKRRALLGSSAPVKYRAQGWNTDGCNRFVTNLFLKKPALGAAFHFCKTRFMRLQE